MRRKNKRVYFDKKVEQDQLKLYQARNAKKMIENSKITSFDQLILLIEKAIPI